jgi:hypothetical protein
LIFLFLFLVSALIFYFTEVLWWGKISQDYNAALASNVSLVFGAGGTTLPHRLARGFGPGNIGLCPFLVTVESIS